MGFVIRAQFGECMFKRLNIKIFVGFSLLLLATIVLLSYFFGRLMLRETETYVLEAFSSRSQIEALEIARDLNSKNSIHDVLRTHEVEFLKSDGTGIGGSINFPRGVLAALLPPSGSVVSECTDSIGHDFYCAITYLPENHLWVLNSTPRSSVLQILASLKREIIDLAFGLLCLSLLLSYFLARWILLPLQRFAEASRKVSRGEYAAIELPTFRSDEIGDYARSFQKMVADLREREAHLAMSGLKLAHSARLASIGQMGASIAHEVKNPLTSMLGYAKILHARTSDRELKEAAEIILKETERCNQILQQMLRFARNDPQERRPYSLKEVVQSALLLINAEAKNRKIEMKVDALSDTVLVGSAQQVQQVLLNLLLNAIQASSEKSEVLVRCREDGKNVVLEIQDHGSGIPQEIQNRIFDPFFTTKGKREGTGLGLSVASEIVHDQGGKITFNSAEGRGTSFQVHLPLTA